jgi:hypothetical protein
MPETSQFLLLHDDNCQVQTRIATSMQAITQKRRETGVIKAGMTIAV